MNMTVDKNVTHYNTTIPSSSRTWPREDAMKRPLNASANKADVFYLNKGLRTDASLVPPIRQTASIFKQPVTIIKNQDSCVNHELKCGAQEKPKQLFWEKRLENLRACNMNGEELKAVDLPLGLQPVGPNISQETLLQSVATALHVYNHPVTGQTAPRSSLEKNCNVFLIPDQPLIHAVSVCDEDIRKQEEKVNEVRRKLKDAINLIQ